MRESNRVYMKIDKLSTLAFLLFSLIFFFSASVSVSKPHNLLLSLIAVAKSSRVTVFFVFNMINIAVFLWSFKPYAVDFDGFFALPMVYETDAAEAASEEGYFWDSDDYDEDQDHGYDGYDEDDDDNSSDEDEIDSEDENEDDLEQRIEEFIAKVNRKWREEVLAEKLLCMAATDHELQYTHYASFI